MKIYIQGSLIENRIFVSDELPTIVYQTYMDSKLGGKFIRETLKLDKLSNCKVSKDDSSLFKASVFLPKTSNRLMTGRRRIGIRAKTNNDRTEIELFEEKTMGLIIGFVAIGLLFCFLPGLFIMLINILQTSWQKKVISKVGTEIKKKYPNAEFLN